MKQKKIDVKLSEDMRLCECGKPGCWRRATQCHHQFPDTKPNRKLYGDLLDHNKNIKWVSHDCHADVPNISEKEFCEMLKIEPRSKTLRQKKYRSWDFGRT